MVRRPRPPAGLTVALYTRELVRRLGEIRARLLAVAVACAIASAAAQIAGPSRSVSVPARQIAAGSGTYYALIIGIDEYHGPDLPVLKTAVGDADAMDKLLRQTYRFQTQVLRNQDATRARILNALAVYRQTLRETDSLLIYYAGHGHYETAADRTYWLPSDASADSPANWISKDDIVSNARVLPARHVLIISDSCFSGGLTRDANIRLGREGPQFLQRMAGSKSRTLLSSGGNEPVADGGGGGHSVFAGVLLGALEQMKTAAFTADELFHTLRQGNYILDVPSKKP